VKPCKIRMGQNNGGAVGLRKFAVGGLTLPPHNGEGRAGRGQEDNLSGFVRDKGGIR